VPDRPEVVLVKLREIKSKIERRSSAKDRSNNIISAKDVVRVVEGACKVCPSSVMILVGCFDSCLSVTFIVFTSMFCQIRGNKDLWNTYTRGCCLSMTGITLNMQVLFVQKRNLAFLLVDQLVAVEEMFVLNHFDLSYT
jgi:hypothetical protein